MLDEESPLRRTLLPPEKNVFGSEDVELKTLAEKLARIPSSNAPLVRPSRHESVLLIADEDDILYANEEETARREALLHCHSHVHHMTPSEKKLMYSYESLDYDVPVNALYRRERMTTDKREQRYDKVARWVFYAIIGATTGALAYGLSKTVERLCEWKFDTISDRIHEGELFVPFLLLFLINGSFVFIATFLVAVVEPVSGGSGIPEVKAYLNGSNYLRFLKPKTLICKAVGVVFSVSAGLLIGKEGPLVHSGAVIAANLSNMSWFNTLTCWTKGTRRWVNRFRNDRDKRDFVAGGAAAGVAAAFGAPVGGILFSLEEASSFWSIQLTWMVFLCAMLGTFMLNALKVLENPGSSFSGLISFGPPLRGVPYRLWETGFFVLLAVIGGFQGAAFNQINASISRWRRDKLQGKRSYRVLEAMLVSSVTTVCAFWMPYFFNNCRVIPDEDRKFSESEEDVFYARFRCAEGEYNTVASILFVTTEKSIRGFFHNTGEYDMASLAAFFVAVFLLAVVTYGIAVPSGLFVPCILMGCAYGRLMGEILRKQFGDDVHPGTYAVIGATASLGGISRMTISLTVIILETTQDVEFVMPIMLTLMVSKWVGDLFNISLYDLHVELKCIPFVEAAPSGNMYNLLAQDVMVKPVCQVRQHVKVRTIVRLLATTTHNGFPVTSSEKPHTLVGMIMRNQLVILLNKKAFGPPRLSMTCVCLDDFSTSLQSKYKKLEPMSIEDHNGVLDLQPFMNPVPIAVQKECPLSRVFTLFRSLGIRHLVVTDASNVPVGIITRKEIMASFNQDLV